LLDCYAATAAAAATTTLSAALPWSQALFFTYTGLSTQDGFKWMGVMTIAMMLLYMLMCECL
jgi:dolichyl-phosphate-mannose--protein O-mannosyl transferase